MKENHSVLGPPLEQRHASFRKRVRFYFYEERNDTKSNDIKIMLRNGKTTLEIRGNVKKPWKRQSLPTKFVQRLFAKLSTNTILVSGSRTSPLFRNFSRLVQNGLPRREVQKSMKFDEVSSIGGDVNLNEKKKRKRKINTRKGICKTSTQNGKTGHRRMTVNDKYLFL
ncbi:uncharacterized protein LOC143152413 [Ptiloglossa arizonensis]|uniref:uncharacterized protein LOC143152413 n=1 Tax=Ptiloglossa arizonensis TaxID=3350558 RepID=UPI003F9FE018